MIAFRNHGIWVAAAGVLLVPLVAMHFTAEVAWTVSDFAMAGLLLAGAAAGYELLAARAAGTTYRAGAAVAVLAGLSLVWVNLAVGMIGSEANAANLLFAGVLAVAAGGALVARGRPPGMARAMAATALAQAAVAALALTMRFGASGAAWDVLGTGLAWTGLWLVAAALFARTARVRGAVQG